MSSSNSHQAVVDGSSPNPMTRIGYGTGFAAGVLLIVTVVTIIAYFCGRRIPIRLQQHEQSHEDYSGELPNRLVVVGGGLDESTLHSYPKLTYAQAVLERRPNSMNSNCCSICLDDYTDSDVLRRIPDCGHAFHLKCVDPWLKLHTSCPICRTNPLTSPMPVPSSVDVVVVPSSENN